MIEVLTTPWLGLATSITTPVLAFVFGYMRGRSYDDRELTKAQKRSGAVWSGSPYQCRSVNLLSRVQCQRNDGHDGNHHAELRGGMSVTWLPRSLTTEAQL